MDVLSFLGSACRSQHILPVVSRPSASTAESASQPRGNQDCRSRSGRLLTPEAFFSLLLLFLSVFPNRAEALAFCSTCKDTWGWEGASPATGGRLYSSWAFFGGTWGKRETWRQKGPYAAGRGAAEADTDKGERVGDLSIAPVSQGSFQEELWKKESYLPPAGASAEDASGGIKEALENMIPGNAERQNLHIRNAIARRMKTNPFFVKRGTSRGQPTTLHGRTYPLFFLQNAAASSFPMSAVPSSPSAHPSATSFSSPRLVGPAPSSPLSSPPAPSPSRLFAYGPKYVFPTQSNRINKKPPPVISSPSAFPALLLTLPPMNITAANPAYVGQHVRLPVLPSADFFSLLTAPRLAYFFPASTRIRNYLRGPHGRIEINQDSQPYFGMLQALAQANNPSDARVAGQEEGGQSLKHSQGALPAERSLTETAQSRGGIMEKETLDAFHVRVGYALEEGVESPQKRKGSIEVARQSDGKEIRAREALMNAQGRTQSSWSRIGRGSAAERRAAADYADLLACLEERDLRMSQRNHTSSFEGVDAEGNYSVNDTSSDWLPSNAEEAGEEDVQEDFEVYGDLKDRANDIPQYKVLFDEIAKFSEKKKQLYKGKKPWREDIHPTKGIFDQPGFPGDALPYIRQHNEEMIAQGKLNQVVNEEDLRCDAFWVDDAGKIVKLKANVHISEIRRGPNPAPVTLERARLIAKLPKDEEEWRFVVTTHLGYIDEKKLKVGDVPEMFTPKYMKELWNNHFALPKRGRAPLVLDDGSIVP